MACHVSFMSSQVTSLFLRNATKKDSFDSCKLVNISTSKNTSTKTQCSSYTSGRLRLLPDDFGKHLLETVLKCLVLAALVELAHKVAARPQGVARKLQGGMAEVHAAGVVAECVSARVHHPVVRVTQRVQPKAIRLGPGF